MEHTNSPTDRNAGQTTYLVNKSSSSVVAVSSLMLQGTNTPPFPPASSASTVATVFGVVATVLLIAIIAIIVSVYFIVKKQKSPKAPKTEPNPGLLL